MNWIKRFKTKWKIDSNSQIVIICIVFAITGSLSLYLAEPLLTCVGATKKNLNDWFFVPLRIIVVFPIYQVVLIIIGTLLGQFTFFWELEKKMLSRLGLKKLCKKQNH